jgi:hypothetical protein
MQDNHAAHRKHEHVYDLRALSALRGFPLHAIALAPRRACFVAAQGGMIGQPGQRETGQVISKRHSAQVSPPLHNWRAAGMFGLLVDRMSS